MRKLFLILTAMSLAIPALAVSAQSDPASHPALVIHHGNAGTPDHWLRVQKAVAREKAVMRENERVTATVSAAANIYSSQYRPTVVSLDATYNATYEKGLKTYLPWVHYGFDTAFNHWLNPVYDIQSAFYGPLVFWLYADSWDDYYYQTWYGTSYDDSRSLQSHFNHPGAFYPTIAIKDLARGISGMPATEQGNFRVGMNGLVAQLQAGAMGRNAIVVTHYQMLDGATVLAGFVGSDDHQFAFEAVLELADSSQNILFIPTGQPADEQLRQLSAMNKRIVDLGGVVIDDATPDHRRGD